MWFWRIVLQNVEGCKIIKTLTGQEDQDGFVNNLKIHMLQVWNVQDVAKSINQKSFIELQKQSIAFSSNSDFIATSCEDGIIYLLKISNFKDEIDYRFNEEFNSLISAILKSFFLFNHNSFEGQRQ